MPESTPAVSVIVPTYNRPERVKEAVRSVLSQTFQGFEVIVVDDGIQTRAQQVINSFDDERVRYIKHERNKGGGAARNTGINAADGEWIAFCDDDRWLPHKLETQLERIDSVAEEIGFCFSGAINTYEDGSSQRSSVDPAGVHDYHTIALRRFSGFLTPTLMIRPAVIESVGGFDELLPSHQEAELMIRATKEVKGLGIDEPLVKVSMDTPDSIGSALSRRIAGREKVLSKHAEEFRSFPHVLANHLFQLGLWYRDSGKYRKAQSNFWRAFRYSRSLRHFLHFLTMLGNGFLYRVFVLPFRAP